MERFQWEAKAAANLIHPNVIQIRAIAVGQDGDQYLLMEYLERYSPEQARRHDALPGITGWAQIHGRNALTWPERFAHDVWYVDHQSVWLDIVILWRTFATVIRREGISAEGHATMYEFAGEERDAD